MLGISPRRARTWGSYTLVSLSLRPKDLQEPATRVKKSKKFPRLPFDESKSFDSLPWLLPSPLLLLLTHNHDCYYHFYYFWRHIAMLTTVTSTTVTFLTYYHDCYRHFHYHYCYHFDHYHHHCDKVFKGRTDSCSSTAVWGFMRVVRGFSSEGSAGRV